MELLSTLKEDTPSSLLVVLVVHLEAREKVFVVDVEKTFSVDYKEKAYAFASVSAAGLVIPLSYYVQATQATLTFLGAPPVFKPLQIFHLHIEEEYEGFT